MQSHQEDTFNLAPIRLVIIHKEVMLQHPQGPIVNQGQLMPYQFTIKGILGFNIKKKQINNNVFEI